MATATAVEWGSGKVSTKERGSAAYSGSMLVARLVLVMALTSAEA